MKYQQYMKNYNYGFGHENYCDGELMKPELKDLLEYLKDEGYECPDIVQGGIPVAIIIDVDNEIEEIQDNLYNNEFAGEDYEMTDEGKEFLIACLEEYNEKYANVGNYCDTINVDVPDEMKYQFEVEE